MWQGKLEMSTPPPLLPSTSEYNQGIIKGVLKAHIHISLSESTTLQEKDAVLIFLSVIT